MSCQPCKQKALSPVTATANFPAAVPPCAFCCRKHLGRAQALLSEVFHYPDRLGAAIGEMSVAEDEIRGLWPDFSEQIRKERLRADVPVLVIPNVTPLLLDLHRRLLLQRQASARPIPQAPATASEQSSMPAAVSPRYPLSVLSVSAAVRESAVRARCPGRSAANADSAFPFPELTIRALESAGCNVWLPDLSEYETRLRVAQATGGERWSGPDKDGKVALGFVFGSALGDELMGSVLPRQLSATGVKVFKVKHRCTETIVANNPHISGWQNAGRIGLGRAYVGDGHHTQCIQRYFKVPEDTFPRPEIYLSPDEKKWAEKQRSEWPSGKPVIIVSTSSFGSVQHPDSYTLRPWRQWISILAQNAVVVRCQSRTETPLNVPPVPGVFELSDLTTRQYMSLFSVADGYFGAESGGAHVAAAFQLPSIVHLTSRIPLSMLQKLPGTCKISRCLYPQNWYSTWEKKTTISVPIQKPNIISNAMFHAVYGSGNAPVVVTPKYTPERDRDVLMALCRTFKPRTVIEFGVQRGCTAKYLLDNCPWISEYVGIDVPPGTVPALRNQIREVPAIAGELVADNPKFRLIIRAKGTADVSSAELPIADMVFIDDDHSAAGVSLATTLARKILRPGGVCCWHDYGNRTAGVTEVIDRLNATDGNQIVWVQGSWTCFETRPHVSLPETPGPARSTVPVLVTQAILDSVMFRSLTAIAGARGIRLDGRLTSNDYNATFSSADSAITWGVKRTHAQYIGNGRNVLFLENGLLRQRYGVIVDHRGFFADSALCRDREFDQIPEPDELTRLFDHIKREWKIDYGVASGDPSGPILIILQVHNDAPLRGPYYPTRAGAEDANLVTLTHCARYLPADKAVIVRPHPRDLAWWNAHQADAAAVIPPHWTIDTAGTDVYAAIARSSALITVNSTVATEALCWHLPVAVLGRSWFTGSDAVLDCSGDPSKLSVLATFRPDPDAITRYLCAILRHTLPYASTPDQISGCASVNVWMDKVQKDITPIPQQPGDTATP